jgi:hypothetical protein
MFTCLDFRSISECFLNADAIKNEANSNTEKPKRTTSLVFNEATKREFTRIYILFYDWFQAAAK